MPRPTGPFLAVILSLTVATAAEEDRSSIIPMLPCVRLEVNAKPPAIHYSLTPADRSRMEVPMKRDGAWVWYEVLDQEVTEMDRPAGHQVRWTSDGPIWSQPLGDLGHLFLGKTIADGPDKDSQDPVLYKNALIDGTIVSLQSGADVDDAELILESWLTPYRTNTYSIIGLFHPEGVNKSLSTAHVVDLPTGLIRSMTSPDNVSVDTKWTSPNAGGWIIGTLKADRYIYRPDGTSIRIPNMNALYEGVTPEGHQYWRVSQPDMTDIKSVALVSEHTEEPVASDPRAPALRIEVFELPSGEVTSKFKIYPIGNPRTRLMSLMYGGKLIIESTSSFTGWQFVDGTDQAIVGASRPVDGLLPSWPALAKSLSTDKGERPVMFDRNGGITFVTLPQ